MKKFLVLIAIIMIPLILIFVFRDSSSKEINELDKMNALISGDARITLYTTYGRYFNLEGEIDSVLPDLALVLKNKDEETYYDLILKETDKGMIFKTNNLINEGINLEKIPNGNYILLLKSGNGENTKYYSLNDVSGEGEDIHYYTITKDQKNRELQFKFEKYKGTSYFNLAVKDTILPDDVYDIVIDAGHGGRDVGASKNGYYESKINLEYALKLKEALEQIGLKVKLTREKDESIANYGQGSRVSIAYEAKAKLLLSIHQNSAVYNVGNGGVEIYVPNHADTKFAVSLANNIVDNTSTIYSKNVSNKIGSGIYLRTFSEDDIESMKKEALEKGYTYYEKATTDSTYYFIIRETGGIVTGAYVDDRYPEKPWNNYYDSNQGIESYLLELGYINSTVNLKILLEEQDKYIEAITKSVKEYLEI